MVILSHPVGNQNVRQALAALHGKELLERYYTSVYWDKEWPVNRWLPNRLRSELNRRCYPQTPGSMIDLTPTREAMRLLATKFGLQGLTRRDEAPLSIMQVSRALDATVAAAITRHPSRAVYTYADSALKTFRAAHRQGMTCIYELTGGHWRFNTELLREEAALQPEYASTIEILGRSPEFLERADEELAMADVVIVPSRFVQRTLEDASVPAGKLFVVPYGAHEHMDLPLRAPRTGSELRVLFVGALTQGKGISYAIDAVKMVSSLAELTLIGKKVGSSRGVDAAVRENRWIESMPHSAVLEEMLKHDVLVLPSISEGFGLVIAEALSCGLPVITTHNSGGPEIIREGREGYLVPIRSASAIAEKLEILALDREQLESMSQAAFRRAQECTWANYRAKLVSTMSCILGLEKRASHA
jgi:glycosyltransferase involved in cell wall biosynthesis